MKRITPLLFTGFFVFMQVSQAQLAQVWKIDGGSDGRYPSTSDWYRGAAYNPATDHYLVISRALTPKIYVHNANTGALLDSLNVTGVTGGTFTLNEIEVTSAGVIYAANLVTAGTGYKIYRWANEAAVPSVAFDGAAGAARIGDVFDVAGTGTGTVIYASGNSSTSVIQRFTTTNGINFTLASPINITGQNAGAGIAQLTAGGNAYISRFQLDNAIKLVDTSGAVVDTIPATLTGRAHADLHYFETGGKKYLAIVPAGDGSTFAPARVLDVTAGPSGAIFVDSTVALGSNANGNASGDVDVKILSANSFVIFVLVGNNGIAAYRYGPPTGVEDADQGVPQTFALQQNYPNPFNPSTAIRYALPEAARVNVSIYNMLGQRVAELTNDVQSAGSYSVVWDGRNSSGMQVATGVYLYRMEATPANGGAQFTSMKKMLLLK